MYNNDGMLQVYPGQVMEWSRCIRYREWNLVMVLRSRGEGPEMVVSNRRSGIEMVVSGGCRGWELKWLNFSVGGFQDVCIKCLVGVEIVVIIDR